MATTSHRLNHPAALRGRDGRRTQDINERKSILVPPDRRPLIGSRRHGLC
jgi:hypothetical protein